MTLAELVRAIARQRDAVLDRETVVEDKRGELQEAERELARDATHLADLIVVHAEIQRQGVGE